jgi:uncharacterized protein (TIGR03382 family)
MFARTLSFSFLAGLGTACVSAHAGTIAAIGAGEFQLTSFVDQDDVRAGRGVFEMFLPGTAITGPQGTGAAYAWVQRFDPNLDVVGLGWNLLLSTASPGVLGDARIAVYTLDNSGQFSLEGVLAEPAAGLSFPGTDQFLSSDDTENVAFRSSGLIDLIGEGMSFSTGTTGIVYLELYTAFPGTAHVYSTDSSVSLEVVPTPGALAVLGLGGLVAGRRRR